MLYTHALPSLHLPRPHFIHNLVFMLLLLRLLLKPIELRARNSTSLGLSFNINSRRFVGLQLVRDIGLLGGFGSLGRAPLLDAAFGVGGFDGGGFVGF